MCAPGDDRAWAGAQEPLLRSTGGLPRKEGCESLSPGKTPYSASGIVERGQDVTRLGVCHPGNFIHWRPNGASAQLARLRPRTRHVAPTQAAPGTGTERPLWVDGLQARE